MKTLIVDGQVCVDGAVCLRAAQPVGAGQVVGVNLAALPEAVGTDRCEPENIPLDVVYEDAQIMVINKAAGMVTHPGVHNAHGTLQSGLLFYHAAAAGLPRGGLAHRLDKNTSGLLVAAKTRAAQSRIVEQFKTRSIGRRYWALVVGAPPPTGVIAQPLERDRKNPKRMAVRADGKEAITRYRVVRQWRGFGMLECVLETGRTHQIRAHLEHAGYPIVGDLVYRARPRLHSLGARRQMLHAHTLRLLHPADGSPREWSCPIPPDMQSVIDRLNAEFSNREEP